LGQDSGEDQKSIGGDLDLAGSYLRRSVLTWPFRCFPLDLRRRHRFPSISRYYLLAKVAVLKLSKR